MSVRLHNTLVLCVLSATAVFVTIRSGVEYGLQLVAAITLGFVASYLARHD